MEFFWASEFIYKHYTEVLTKIFNIIVLGSDPTILSVDKPLLSITWKSFYEPHVVLIRRKT